MSWVWEISWALESDVGHYVQAYKIVTPFTMLFGCAQGIIAMFWWSVIDQRSGESYSMVPLPRTPRTIPRSSLPISRGQPLCKFRCSKFLGSTNGTCDFLFIWPSAVLAGRTLIAVAEPAKLLIQMLPHANHCSKCNTSRDPLSFSFGCTGSTTCCLGYLQGDCDHLIA